MIAPRSMVVRSGIRMASPLAVVVGVMLFFSGHNQPGGGFAAGLVFGAVVALRAVVGLSFPRNSAMILAIGGVIAGAVALTPMLAGQPLLDMVVVERELPLLGKVKSGTALVFDLGVSLIVVGLVVALVDGLGAVELDEPHESTRLRPDGAPATSAPSGEEAS